MCAKDEKTSDDRIEVTPEMIDAGYIAYLADRLRIEDGEKEDRRIAFTSIFLEMTRARFLQKEE